MCVVWCGVRACVCVCVHVSERVCVRAFVHVCKNASTQSHRLKQLTIKQIN